MGLTAEIRVNIGAQAPDTEMFYASKLKVRQARRHIQRLQVMQEDHFMTDWFTCEFKPATVTDIAELTVMVKYPDAEFGAVMGDIIHNCRASLDILACSLVHLNQENLDNKKDIYFPFAKDKNHLEEMIKKKNFKLASPDAIQIVRELKPYKSNGNKLLRAIHDLDVYDKHRGLIASGSKVISPEVQADVIGGKIIHSIVDNSKPQMRLVFPEDGPLPNYEIIPVLNECIRHIEGIIETFEAIKP